MFLTLKGLGYLVIVQTCSRSITTLSSVAIKPRNSTNLVKNAHLLVLATRSYSTSQLSTFLTCLLCSFLSSKQIRILLRYTTQILSNKPPRALQIYNQNVARAFANLKGIIRYLKCLYCVLNAVFYLLPSLLQSL